MAKKKIAQSKKKASKKKSILVDDLNFVMNNLTLPIVVLDKKGKVRRYNESWKEMFGVNGNQDYANEDYFGLLESYQKRKIYLPSVKEKIEQILKKAISGNLKPKFLEFPIHEKWFLSHMHPVQTKDVLDGFIITHHDVTVWKQKELTLQREKTETFENSQRKMFFLANLNHELKSPLNSIIGFSELLKEEIAKNEHLEGYAGMIENIVEGASHLKSIVFRILNMAKIESGTLTLQEERVAPAKLIQLSLNLIQPMYPNRSIQVEICKLAAKETLKCDKNLVMEVLINLIVNSLKFSHEPIRIHCTVDDKKNLIFNVIDKGIGMTEKEVSVALEPFGQNIRTPNDKDTGLGLGVPFCNQVMKLHGGVLKIQSEKGRGTTVSAEFPANRILI